MFSVHVLFDSSIKIVLLYAYLPQCQICRKKIVFADQLHSLWVESIQSCKNRLRKIGYFKYWFAWSKKTARELSVNISCVLHFEFSFFSRPNLFQFARMIHVNQKHVKKLDSYNNTNLSQKFLVATLTQNRRAQLLTATPNR